MENPMVAHFANTTAQNGSDNNIVLAFIVIAILASVLAHLISSLWKRHLVIKSSIAIHKLRALNRSHATNNRRIWWTRITLVYVDRVNSKAKFDRYNLENFFHEQLLRNEHEIEQMLAGRKRELSVYDDYLKDVDELAAEYLGESSHSKLGRSLYCRLEIKYFLKEQIPRPKYRTNIQAVVRYTSPKGQNSYERDITWNFYGLIKEFDKARADRRRKLTVEFQRQQERNKVTSRMRYRVLKRDNSTCQLCYARGEDGVSLEVDHIHPISKGGSSRMSNLQTLCSDCNRGKGNLIL